jgi:hypothetical protein
MSTFPALLKYEQRLNLNLRQTVEATVWQQFLRL